MRWSRGFAALPLSREYDNAIEWQFSCSYVDSNPILMKQFRKIAEISFLFTAFATTVMQSSVMFSVSMLLSITWTGNGTMALFIVSSLSMFGEVLIDYKYDYSFSTAHPPLLPTCSWRTTSLNREGKMASADDAAVGLVLAIVLVVVLLIGVGFVLNPRDVSRDRHRNRAHELNLIARWKMNTGKRTWYGRRIAPTDAVWGTLSWSYLVGMRWRGAEAWEGLVWSR